MPLPSPAFPSVSTWTSHDLLRIEDLLTDSERATRDRVREFGEREILPVINDYWERGDLPFPVIKRFGELEVAGGQIGGYGCPGLTPVGEGLVAMELARADGSVATFWAVHTGLAMKAIALLGSEEQKQEWLPEMASCERLGAFALTEPEHGSDVSGLETSARRDGNHWVLNGAKRWIGLGSVADYVIVWARDENGSVGGFVVDRSAGEVEGYAARVIAGKAANRAMWQAEITLTDVRVPAEHRLAGARSFADTARVLAVSRQGVAWEALGHAIAAYECALAYARARTQFGRPIARFQLIQDKLARMLADVIGMQMFCYRLGRLQEQGQATPAAASLAKLNTAAGARRVCADARDILGGNGILLEYHVARHMADIEATYTYEGTDAVQALIVGREITGLGAFV
jgi:glutaryl-CoA dehydrogenase